MQYENILGEGTSIKEVMRTRFEFDTDSGFFVLDGSWKYKSFTISRDGIEVAKISRKPFSKKNKYGIAINAQEDQNILLMISFCIEFYNKVRQARSAG